MAFARMPCTSMFRCNLRHAPRRARFTWPQGEKYAAVRGLADWVHGDERFADRRRSVVANRTPTTPPKREPILDPANAAIEERREGDGGRFNADDRQDNQVPTEGEAVSAGSPPTRPTSTRWDRLRKYLSPTELKRLTREYGPVAAVFHTSVFFATLGGCYTLIDYGGVDVMSYLQNVPTMADKMPHPGAGNLALAWALTTMTGPVRGIMTITLTPKVARLWWGRDAKRKLESIARATAKKL